VVHGTSLHGGAHMSLRTKSVLGTIATSSFLIAAALFATAVQADARPDQTTIHLGDLRLDRPADVAVMYQRINLAAEQVCRQHALNGSDVISLPRVLRRRHGRKGGCQY